MKLTFYIIKDRCQIHALKVFRSPVWLLLHKLSSPHYRHIRKMRRGDRLPLTQIPTISVLNALRYYQAFRVLSQDKLNQDVYKMVILVYLYLKNKI
jgi:hypothetical protein